MVSLEQAVCCIALLQEHSAMTSQAAATPLLCKIRLSRTHCYLRKSAEDISRNIYTYIISRFPKRYSDSFVLQLG